MSCLVFVELIRDMQLLCIMQNGTFSSICKTNVSLNAISFTLPSLLFLLCIIYQDLCKPFDIILWDIIFSKLERHIFDRWTTQWVRNWLDVRTQSVAVNGSVSKWRAVMSGDPRGQYKCLKMFNIFVGNRVRGIEALVLTAPSCVGQSICWSKGVPWHGNKMTFKVPSCPNHSLVLWSGQARTPLVRL